MTDEPSDRPYVHQTLFGISYLFAGEWDQDPVPEFPIAEVVAQLRKRAAHSTGAVTDDARTLRWCAQLLEDGFPPGSRVNFGDIGVFLAPHTAECA